MFCLDVVPDHDIVVDRCRLCVIHLFVIWLICQVIGMRLASVQMSRLFGLEHGHVGADREI